LPLSIPQNTRNDISDNVEIARFIKYELWVQIQPFVAIGIHFRYDSYIWEMRTKFKHQAVTMIANATS
jgi:hypothetical protein